MKKNNIIILGGGSIGTALGNAIAENNTNNVCILSIEEEVVKSISDENKNLKYFPNFTLNSRIKATKNAEVLNNADAIFLALPSAVIIDYLLSLKNNINADTPMINLAKGFGSQQRTIFECLKENFTNPICSFKGPTFARELMEDAPTAFTFAAEDKSIFHDIKKVFENSIINLDYSKDVLGVELLSILKNIYAIVIGIVDARFNSPNLKFLILAKAFKEMREILLQFGGKEKTLFKYCGFGDFTLTSLNDLSRNRTLGLFVGKGFFTKDISDQVLLEGKIATKIFCEEISKKNSVKNHHIIKELYKVFNTDYDISEFVDRILKH